MESNLISNQIGISFLIVHGLELLKKWDKFPWLTCNTEVLNRWVSIGLAALTSAGFVFVLQGNWQLGGTLTITLPPATKVIEFLLFTAGQAGIQETYYKAAVRQ